MIHACVREYFYDFSARFEGVIPWIYLDCKSLATIAVGCLIDPVETALPLPFVRDGGPATRAEIAAEWHAIKSHPELAVKGAGAARALCSLRLTDEGVRDLVAHRLDQTVAALARRFPLASWPANAQLAVLSMAWAMGSGFHFPKFEAHVRALDFDAAALECTIKEEGNAGVKPRNVANREHFARAAIVLRAGLPLDEFLDPDFTEDVDP